LKLVENTEPRTRTAARKLRALSLAAKEGSFLGSEADLIAELGVSRPTFRQAARLVEHEQLLVITRGVGGGFHARRPDVSSVVSSAVTFMLTEKLRLSDLFSASSALTIEAARLASACSDEQQRQRAARLVKRLAPAERVPQEWPEFHREETEILELLCDMSGNGAINLLLRVLFQFGSIGFPIGVFHGREDLMQTRRTSRLRMLRAVLDGDPQIVTVMMYRDVEFIAANADPGAMALEGDISRFISLSGH
jgi:DNA-binding FadR family transcriptional regulator